MAEANELAEVTVNGKVLTDVNFSMYKFASLDLLKSCRYALQLVGSTPSVLDPYGELRELTLLTESIEFPGKTLNTIDYRMAGRNKIKIPISKDYNEITVTFYASKQFPIYEFFSDWIDEASFKSDMNSYFEEIACSKISLVQFTENADLTSSPDGLSTGINLEKYNKLDLLNIYPINIASMPSSWSDDGFQRLTATFFFEEYSFDQRVKLPNFSVFSKNSLVEVDALSTINSLTLPTI
jgi:hypothetical protein